MKRYWVNPKYTQPVLPDIEPMTGIIELVVRYDDHLEETTKLKDSLIVWHNLRENPEDLPEESEEVVYVTGGGGHGLATMIGDEWADNYGPILNVILWHYSPKPPKE